MGFHAGFLDLHRPDVYFVDEVRDSMSNRPRSLPPGFALDAVGHALYARVTALPNYTRARTESDLLREHRQEMLALAGNPREIVDLQAGAAVQPRPLIDEMERYVAIDACRPVLDDAIDGLAAAFPRLDVKGIVGDSAFGLAVCPSDGDARLVVLLDGALGRLDPTAARLELARVRSHMEPADRLVIGVDLAGDERHLADPYDDPIDVFPAYVRNALRRANREVGTDFRSADWSLVIEPQPSHGRVEIRFEAKGFVTVDGGKAGGSWDFLPEEPLVVERAHKPTEGQGAATAIGAGFNIEGVWKDRAQSYALFMLRP